MAVFLIQLAAVVEVLVAETGRRRAADGLLETCCSV